MSSCAAVPGAVLRPDRRNEPMKIHDLITTTAALADLCGRLAKSDFVTVDTEFMRENTYWPELCLVQIANTEEAAAIDPLAEGIDLTALLDLMCDNEDVLKVFHAGGQDVEIVYNLTGKTPHPIFDTQIAIDGDQPVRTDRLCQPRRKLARHHGRQGRALHRLEPPPADRAADRIRDRRRHPPGGDLPAHAQEADQDRARRVARRRDGKARRSGELRQRSRRSVAAHPRAEPQPARARAPQGAGRVARERGAAQEHPARADHARRDARPTSPAIRPRSRPTWPRSAG